MRTLTRSKELLEASKQYLAGGAPSAIETLFLPHPVLIDHGEGSHFYDVDGNEYIDYVLGFGPLILGHCPLVVIEAVTDQLRRGSAFGAPYVALAELSRRVCEILPSVEMVRFNNSGTEAVQGALRVARAFSGRSKIIKFEGHYHGWLDNVYISHSPDSLGLMGMPNAPRALLSTAGQVASGIEDLLILPWNDLEAVERTLKAHGHEMAAIIMEPIMANCGVIMPLPGYLEGVRKLTREYQVLLIFDEVITGFRTSLTGAQGYFKVIPDMTVFAKAFGGGYPISGFGGRSEIMQLIAENTVIHAGTLNANPLVVAAASATVKELSRDNGAVLKGIAQKGKKLMDGIDEVAKQRGVPMIIQGPGAFFGAVFGEGTLVDYRSNFRLNQERARKYAQEMLLNGVYCFPKGRGLYYLSAAHTEADIDRTLEIIDDVLTRI